MIDRIIPTEDGHWVNEKFHRLAEIIQDYDPYFALHFIPPDQRTSPEDDRKAFAIVDSTPGYDPYVILYADVNDDPAKILAKLWENDIAKRGASAVLSSIDLHNTAVELIEQKKREEEAAAQQDMVRFLVGTPLHTIRLGDGIKLDSHFRRIE